MEAANLVRVAVTTRYFEPAAIRYAADLAERRIQITASTSHEGPLDEDRLVEVVRGADALVCGDDVVTERVLRASDRLRVVCKWGTGIDAIDTAAAAQLGVRVLRTPGAFTDPVADTTLAYILAFARNIRDYDQAVRTCRPPEVQAYSLSERTVGVVGAGDIGRAVVRRLRAFDTRVLVTEPEPTARDESARLGAELVDLPVLLSKSDFITLHCSLTESTHHLLDERALRSTKRDAVIINTARGSLIDERSLVDVLRSGHLRGVALDVFETEPLQVDSPLRDLPNVFLSPHTSNASPQAHERTAKATVKALLSALGLDVPRRDACA